MDTDIAVKLYVFYPSLLGKSGLALHFRNAGRADVFAFEVDDFVGLSAENTGRLVLLENDAIAININLQGILFANAKCPSQFDGNHDSS